MAEVLRALDSGISSLFILIILELALVQASLSIRIHVPIRAWVMRYITTSTIHPINSALPVNMD